MLRATYAVGGELLGVTSLEPLGQPFLDRVPKSLNSVSEWVCSRARAERAIETACWPSYSQWFTGGVSMLLSVVGTPEPCR